MQVVDSSGNVFGSGGLEITTSNGKPKIPVINTDITIGTTAIVGGVSGRLLYDNAGKVDETTNISWNSSTNILTLNSDISYTTYNRTIASSSYPLGTLFTGTIRSISQINQSGGTNGLTIGGNGGSPIFRIYDSGNTVIQTNGTFVDAGFKLDVIGSTRVTSLKTADIFPASASISLWTNSLNATSRFYTAPVHQDGRINFNAIAGGSDQVLIRAWHTGAFALGTGSSAAGGALTVRGDSLLIGTSGSLYIMAGTFGPLNVPYRLGITTNATTTGFHTGVVNNLTNIESAKFEYTAVSHTFYTGTTTGNQGNPNQYTPLFLSNLGNVGIGTITLGTATKLTIGGTQTALSALGRGIGMDTILVAAANNDVLVGLDIAPTFTNGAFTGVTNVDLRTKGIGLVIGSGVGYGALYGYSNDGVLQVTDGGTSAITGFTYATQLWLRPSGNATGLNSNYWATIEQSTGGLYIQSGRYNSNLYLRTGRAGTSGNIYFNNAGGTMAMFFGATANLGIGTTTDAGYKLDVNGTIRSTGTNGLILSDGTYAAKTWMNGYTYTIEKVGSYGISTYQLKYNDTTDALYLSSTSIRGDASYGVVMSRSIYAPHNGAFGFLTYGTTTQYTAIQALYTDNNSSGIAFNYKTANVDTEAMRITSVGRVGIGTTIPFGKFDVKDGEIFVTTSTDANLRSRLTYQGLYVSRASDGGYAENIISTSSAWFYNSRNSHTFFKDTIPLLTIGSLQSTAGITINNNGNVLINTATDAGWKLDVNGIAMIRGTLELQNTAGMRMRSSSGIASTSFRPNGSDAEIRTNDASVASVYFNQNGIVGFSQQVAFGSTTASSTSAQVQVDSTTRGFLPPRMTNAQMIAIATPAEGLVVYDTTNRRLCCYDGATWQNLF